MLAASPFGYIDLLNSMLQVAVICVVALCSDSPPIHSDRRLSLVCFCKLSMWVTG